MLIFFFLNNFWFGNGRFQAKENKNNRKTRQTKQILIYVEKYQTQDNKS